MTDKNVDKRLLFTLYMEIASKGMELKWAAEEWARTHALWVGKDLESAEAQSRRMESASMPLRQCIRRMLRLLRTPETGEPNSFTLEHGLETDIQLLRNYRTSLEGTYTEVTVAVDTYTAQIFARLEELFMEHLDGGASKEKFGENLTMDLSGALPRESGIAVDRYEESL